MHSNTTIIKTEIQPADDSYLNGGVISKSDLVIKDRCFSGSLYARMIHEDGRPYHTFRTASLLVDGSNIVFEDCRFENLAGKGEDAGQAIALYLDGSNIRLKNCVIAGHQDTLFLAPLPEKELEPDGFLGPKQFSPRTNRTFYFENCYIEGGVDFIFGGANAYFDHCEFRSNEPGFVFAPSTPKDVSTGFTARNCRFTADRSVADASCYIARPWREYGKVRLENCFLGKHIAPEGFDDWGKTAARETVVFEEISSYGPGACNKKRPSWVKLS